MCAAFKKKPTKFGSKFRIEKLMLNWRYDAFYAERCRTKKKNRTKPVLQVLYISAYNIEARSKKKISKVFSLFTTKMLHRIFVVNKLINFIDFVYKFTNCVCTSNPCVSVLCILAAQAPFTLRKKRVLHKHTEHRNFIL